MVQQPDRSTPAVGDVFAVPLDGGRFAACRIVRQRARSETFLVANVDWIELAIPEIGSPKLRSVLRLTHHSWKGKPSVVWVNGLPPKEYVYLGNVVEESTDARPFEKDVPANVGTGAWVFFRIQPQAQWYWDHPEDVPPPPPPPEGRFVLHRFNGDEVFGLESAVMLAYESAEGVTLWFEAKAERENAVWCDDTEEMQRTPSAKVGVELSALDVTTLVGREFIIPGTKSDDEDSCMSLLYYCEHEPLRENLVRVLSQAGDRFRLQWTAVTQDVNHYDGSRPPTRVEIEGEFRFKDFEKWL